MNLYSIPTFFTSFLIISLGFFSFKKNPRSPINRAFFSLCLFPGVWLFFSSIADNFSSSDPLASFFVKICYLGVINVCVATLHFTIVFLDLKKFKKIIPFFYLTGIAWGVCLFSTNLLLDGFLKYSWGCYAKAGMLHPFFIIFFIATVVCSNVLLILSFLKGSVSGLKRLQVKYVVSAIFIFSFASVDFLPNYGIPIYPFGYIPTVIFIAIIAYGIVRHRLLDISVAISNTAIFIAVYALVLGAPFYLYAIGFKLTALFVMLVLATAGPFILFYLQRKIEERLLQEQRRYQATLRQASAGMGKIKDLKKLLDMIVHVLAHAVQIEHALIYIYDGAKKQYVLGACERKSGYNSFTHNIEEKSSLVQYLLNNKSLIILEEIKQRAEDAKDSQLAQIAQIILSLEGALVVPIFIDENFAAIIIMGKKESGKLYTEDDLGVFSILANQTALAIENAKFYEDMKQTHQQLFQAEKMATIGTMADGLSHQINNRFHALGFIAGDALDTIHLNKDEPMSDKMKAVMTEFERAFVRVQENVVQGGEIVQGLLKYTRKGEAGFTAIDLEAVFKSALEMAQFKIKTQELKIIRDYDPAAIPKIKGNFTQLQEVFFNLIDNGYDAMMQRKNEKNEPDYQPTLKVHVLKEDGFAQVIFEDNGMGVKEEDMRKLFTPFFTTKLSSKKGTGLGLYVIKKIVEDNHGGQVEMVSQYMQGTQMKLLLPVAID